MAPTDFVTFHGKDLWQIQTYNALLKAAGLGSVKWEEYLDMKAIAEQHAQEAAACRTCATDAGAMQAAQAAVDSAELELAAVQHALYAYRRRKMLMDRFKSLSQELRGQEMATLKQTVMRGGAFTPDEVKEVAGISLLYREGAEFKVPTTEGGAVDYLKLVSSPAGNKSE